MNYIGIDLAWKKENPSALAAWTSEGVAVLRRKIQSADIPGIVRELSIGPTCVAVDAPLIIRNKPSSQRPCETAVSRTFGKYDASAHTMNCANKYAPHLREFSGQMRDCGLQFLPPSDSWNADGRWLVEVYPHPAQTTLLDNLPQRDGRKVIHKYKKGPVDERCKGMREFANDLRAALHRHMRDFAASPEIDGLLSEDYARLDEEDLKAAEDALDACFCVLIAERIMAAGGADKCHYLGDLENGFIVVPK